MIIRFNSIRLNNFMSFADEFIQLDNLGYTLVSGKNEAVDDSAVSNGSGKSSIWEGIVWALTGETIRGNKNVVNLFGDDGALVILDFNVDNDNYIIQRTKEHSKLKSSLTISLNGNDISGKGIRDSENILKQHIPDLTSSLLSSVVILGQGLPQRFSNNTPSGRKQVLEELSKSDFMIEDLKQRISNRKTVLNNLLVDTQKNSLTLQTKRNIFIEQLTTEKEKLQSILSSNTVELQQAVDKLKKDFEDLCSEIDEIEQCNTTKKKQIDDLKEEFYAKQSESATEVSKINSRYAEESNKLEVDIVKIQSVLSASKKELSRLKDITDVCPTCGQKLVGVTKPDTTELEVSIQKLELELKDLKSKQLLLNTAKTNDLKNNDALYVEQLTSIQLHKEAIVKEVESSERRSRLLTSKKEGVTKELTDVEHLLRTIKDEKQTTEEKIKHLSTDIERLDGKLLYYNNEEENTKNHLSVVNKMETVVKRDFRGCLLKNVIDFIDSQSKKYSRIVFDNNLIEFKQEGNNISISFDNKEYESLSGGEQKKLDIIVQLAIRDMLCHLMNFSSNILVCDEIFDALDITGCQKIIDLVSTQLEDVSSVFIVTHRDNLCIPCDNEITVIKDMNKISHVIQKA